MSLDFSKLSPSQYYILIRLSQGYSTEEIAKERGSSKRTVSNHIRGFKVVLDTKLSTRKIITEYYKILYPDLKYNKQDISIKWQYRGTMIRNSKGSSIKTITRQLGTTTNTIHQRLRKLRREYGVKTNQGLAYAWLREVNPYFYVPDPIEIRNIT